MEPNIQGKGRFWNWVKRNVHIIAAVATVVGLPAIGIALEAAVLADGGSASGNVGTEQEQQNQITMRTLAEYEPTPSEAIILDPWVKNKLTPFYQQLLTKAKSAFESSDYNFQLNTINDVTMKMCIVKEYYKTRESAGLSLNAMTLRNALIEEIFLPVEEMIANSIKNSANLTIIKYPVSIGSTSGFYPLDIKNFTASCEKYTTTGNQGANVNNGSLLTLSPVVVNPTTNQVIQGQTKTITEDKSNKSNIGLLFLGLLGIAILLYSDDEDKKNEKKSKKQSESEE